MLDCGGLALARAASVQVLGGELRGLLGGGGAGGRLRIGCCGSLDGRGCRRCGARGTGLRGNGRLGGSSIAFGRFGT